MSTGNQPKILNMSKIIFLHTFFFCFLAVFFCVRPLQAGNVHVQKVDLIRLDRCWAADVWLSHKDEGRKHYANWIEVRYDNGIDGGCRLVRRDIVKPTKDNRTRFFYRIYLPEIPDIATKLIFIGHCNVHSHGGEVVEVFLKNKSGERYSVRRERKDIFKYASRTLKSDYFRSPLLRKRLAESR